MREATIYTIFLKHSRVLMQGRAARRRISRRCMRHDAMRAIDIFAIDFAQAENDNVLHFNTK